MSELAALVLRLNVALAAAVLAALILRLPARRLFGPRIAYGVWALVPIAALAMLPPPRVVPVVGHWAAAPIAAMAARPPVHATPAPTAHVSLADILPLLIAGLWLLGAVVAAARLARRQAEFARAERAGAAGPAVVGVLKPHIVTPDDFAQRYTERERELVLAHEATHIA